MAKHLEQLARRQEQDPFFLACPLRLYAASEGLDDDALAARLRCTREAITLMSLCRAPQGEDESFPDDIGHIAATFGVDVHALLEAVRRGQAIWQLRRAANAGATLLAARDGKEHASDDPKGNKP